MLHVWIMYLTVKHGRKRGNGGWVNIPMEHLGFDIFDIHDQLFGPKMTPTFLNVHLVGGFNPSEKY